MNPGHRSAVSVSMQWSITVWVTTNRLNSSRLIKTHMYAYMYSVWTFRMYVRVEKYDNATILTFLFTQRYTCVLYRIKRHHTAKARCLGHCDQLGVPWKKRRCLLITSTVLPCRNQFRIFLETVLARRPSRASPCPRDRRTQSVELY